MSSDTACAVEAPVVWAFRCKAQVEHMVFAPAVAKFLVFRHFQHPVLVFILDDLIRILVPDVLVSSGIMNRLKAVSHNITL